MNCSGCGQPPDWDHSRYVRHVADEAIGGRPVLIDVSVRRLYCENPGCAKTTFVEQVDGLTERYQRRTPALRRLIEAVAVVLAGSAAVRLLTVLHQTLSSATVLNRLMRSHCRSGRRPQWPEFDEFALLKGHRYATIIIDADNGQRVEVLPDRKMATVTAWLREHPGIRVVCRDGSGGFAQATTDADPTIVQISDRWHLTQAALKEVGGQASCWGKFGPPLPEGKRATTTRERWKQVHDLLDQGVGLLACARRLGVSLNTVKRYAPLRRAGPHGPRPRLPVQSRRPLPRPPAQTPHRRPRRPHHPPARGDPRAGLHRQRQPPGPLHQPGPRRGRPRGPLPPARSPACSPATPTTSTTSSTPRETNLPAPAPK